MWIWLLGLLLGGIVAMQVSMLKLNTGISRAVTTMGTLERQNANSKPTSRGWRPIDRVRNAALAEGMVRGAAGSMEFPSARPGAIPGRPPGAARRRATTPAAVMANDGSSRRSRPWLRC